MAFYSIIGLSPRLIGPKARRIIRRAIMFSQL
jgi:hypothetical protein